MKQEVLNFKHGSRGGAGPHVLVKPFKPGPRELFKQWPRCKSGPEHRVLVGGLSRGFASPLGNCGSVCPAFQEAGLTIPFRGHRLNLPGTPTGLVEVLPEITDGAGLVSAAILWASLDSAGSHQGAETEMIGFIQRGACPSHGQNWTPIEGAQRFSTANRREPVQWPVIRPWSSGPLRRTDSDQQPVLV